MKEILMMEIKKQINRTVKKKAAEGLGEWPDCIGIFYQPPKPMNKKTYK